MPCVAGSITASRYSEPGVGILTPNEAPTSGGSKQKFYSYNYGEASLPQLPRDAAWDGTLGMLIWYRIQL